MGNRRIKQDDTQTKTGRRPGGTLLQPEEALTYVRDPETGNLIPLDEYAAREQAGDNQPAPQTED